MMRSILTLIITFTTLSSFAEPCSESFVENEVYTYETVENPYRNGEFEVTVETVDLYESDEDTYFYNVNTSYEYSEGGYRILQVVAVETDGECAVTSIEITDEQ